MKTVVFVTDDAVMSWAIAFAYLAEAVSEVERLDRQRISREAIAGRIGELFKNAIAKCG